MFGHFNPADNLINRRSWINRLGAGAGAIGLASVLAATDPRRRCQPLGLCGCTCRTALSTAPDVSRASKADHPPVYEWRTFAG
ncbi:MAG UNVERIFIED_CONTAM: hypothetical protein LVR18_30110 [Planctomycetaceae bacterium]|jgi:hypothetical protein